MKRLGRFLNLILTAYLLSIQLISVAQNTCKEIVGYYPNWQWYDRNKLVNPQSIEYTKYSVINYCFFKPLPNGDIESTDTWADENLLLGQINWSTGGYYPNTSIVELAHNAGTKIIPSIGGWTLSDNFPSIAADPIKRQNFANACVALINQYDFDGIDIDWEYPGFTDHGGTTSDIINFSLFLQAIRDALDIAEQSNGRTYILTAAVGAAEERMDDVNWTEVGELLDMINLMSYDFFGAWEPITNHNSPLYAPTQGNTTFNIDHAVQKLLNEYSVPASKINVGIPFYGRSMKTIGTATLHGNTAGGADLTTFSVDEGTPLYYNILLKMGLFNSAWDDNAKVPYLTGKDGLNTFVSYDNEASVEQKAEYIVSNNLRGAIIWEITGDYIETYAGSGVIAETPLINTINDVFCNSTTSDPIEITSSGPTNFCQGNQVILTSNYSVNNLWSNGETTQAITVSSSGTYYVINTVTGESSNEINVIVESNPVSYFSSMTNPSECGGNGLAVLNSDYSTLSIYYTGTSSGIIENASIPFAIDFLSAGEYNFYTVSSNGCESNDFNLTFNDPTPTNPIISSDQNHLCPGESVEISSDLILDVYEWSSGQSTAVIVTSEPGTYTLEGLIDNCAVVSNAIEITTSIEPSFSITPINPVSEIELPFLLNNVDPSGGIYAGLGVTENEFDPSTANIGINTITYQYFDAFGCEFITEFDIEVYASNVGIGNKILDYLVYPNPTSGQLYIEFPTPFSVSVLNPLGEEVVSPSYNLNKTSLNIEHLSCGMYLLKITSEQGIQLINISKLN